MLTVAGKRFKCECGANVLTRVKDYKGQVAYACNGCRTEYTGTDQPLPAPEDAP